MKKTILISLLFLSSVFVFGQNQFATGSMGKYLRNGNNFRYIPNPGLHYSMLCDSIIFKSDGSYFNTANLPFGGYFSLVHPNSSYIYSPDYSLILPMIYNSDSSMVFYSDYSTNNIFIGRNSGTGPTSKSGINNSFLGAYSGYYITAGNNNSFIGSYSGYSTTNGSYNTFLGDSSGYYNVTGSYNTYIGGRSGYSSTGSSNLYAGRFAGYYMGSESNRIILNTKNRTSKAKDTLFSPYYCRQTNDTLTQHTDLNGNVNIRGNLTLHGLPLPSGSSKWEYSHSGSNYILPSNSKQVILNSLYNSDSTINFMMNNNDDLFIGTHVGTGSTEGSNTFVGDWAGYSALGGSSNVYLGSTAGYSQTVGNFNGYFGTNAGQYVLTGDSIILINTTDRQNLHYDTVGSPIFIRQSFDISKQKIEFNGKVNINGNFTINGNPVGGSSKWSYLYPGSDYILPSNSKKVAINELYSADSVRTYYADINTSNTLLGDYTGIGLTGTMNVFLGSSSGSNSSTGSYNTFLGVVSGSSNTIGSHNLYLGYAAGQYMTTEKGISIFNSYDQINKLGDSTKSWMYVRQDQNPIYTRGYFNGNLKISKSLTINNDTVFVRNDTSKTGKNGLVTKWYADGRYAFKGSGGGGVNYWTTPSGSTASSYRLLDNSKRLMASTLYTSDSLIAFNYYNTNIIISKSTNNTYTGLRNIIMGDGENGKYLGAGNDNIGLGWGAGGRIIDGNRNVHIGYQAGYTDGYYSTANDNIAIGTGALADGIPTGDRILALGYSAGRLITTGGYNNFIGNYAGFYMTTQSGRTVINNYDRVNLGGDTTKSFYMYQTASGLGQMMYWGGGLFIKNNITTNGTYNYGEDAGSSDTYSALIPYITVYTKGMQISFYANTANTGACTININGLGVISLKVLHDQDPPDNYIESGSMITAIYDGSNFQIMTPDANP